MRVRDDAADYKRKVSSDAHSGAGDSISYARSRPLHAGPNTGSDSVRR